MLHQDHPCFRPIVRRIFCGINSKYLRVPSGSISCKPVKHERKKGMKILRPKHNSSTVRQKHNSLLSSPFKFTIHSIWFKNNLKPNIIRFFRFTRRKAHRVTLLLVTNFSNSLKNPKDRNILSGFNMHVQVPYLTAFK